MLPVSRLLALFIILFSAGCTTTLSDQQVEADARQLAQIYCQAQELRTERFKLADDIRMLEDTLMMYPDAPESAARKIALENLQAGTTDMWRRTKTMADSINHLLETFYKGSYPEKADRNRLDQALEKVMHEICATNSELKN
jgi:cell division protein FtsB